MTFLEWDRHQITTAVVEEFGDFAALVGELGEAECLATTRCTGWTVRHVVGHVAGTAIDILDGTIGHRTPDEQAAAFSSWSGPELATVLSEASQRLWIHLASLDDSVWNGPVEGVPGQLFSTGVLTLMHELCVHTDDIDTALGRASVTDRLLTVSTLWLATEFERLKLDPLTIELSDRPTLRINGGGRVVETDALTFIRVTTGRMDPGEIGLDSNVNIYGRDRGHVGV
jgi:uncharacterized protein (TIGR03083 family)